MDSRYIKNLDATFSEELQNTLLSKKIAIIGCGGQGGYISEFVARLGVKQIYLWDGDIYTRSNLNRQICCLENNIGENKAISVEKRIKSINADIIVQSFPQFFGDDEKDLYLLAECDFIFLSFDDSQDILKARSLIRTVIQYGIPAIDCPNDLLGGFISINTKKDLSHYDLFTDILVKQKNSPKSKEGFSQGYKCALIAAEAVNCMVQYFDNNKFSPVNSKLSIDLYHHKYTLSDKFGII